MDAQLMSPGGVICTPSTNWTANLFSHTLFILFTLRFANGLSTTLEAARQGVYKYRTQRKHILNFSHSPSISCFKNEFETAGRQAE